MNGTGHKLIIIFVFVIIGTSIMASGVSAGLLSDLLDNIGRWFESSPLGGLFSRPVKRMVEMNLTFYPEGFTFSPESMVNVTSDSTKVSNFNGNIEVDLKNDIVLLKVSNSGMTIEERIETIEIHGLSFSNLELSSMKLSMVSGNWTEMTKSGSLKVYDFLGEGTITPEYIQLVGNVSKVSKE